MLKVIRGALVEYSVSIPPLALSFDFNPQTITRSRTLTTKSSSAPGARGGYDFASPFDANRAALGVTAQPETLSVTILLDATDRMQDGDPVASRMGVQPEIDTLRTMVEPKTQGPQGQQVLARLSTGESPAFQRNETVSVLLFIWGSQTLPVFLTSVRIEEKAHLPSLAPYRAEANLSMQVIEGNNPFYSLESRRRLVGAATAGTRLAVDLLGGRLS